MSLKVLYKIYRTNTNYKEIAIRNFVLCLYCYFVDGPTWQLHLKPNRRTYEKRPGELAPEITCFTECSPACSLSWGTHIPSNILKLGHITKEKKGEYTCSAIRNGTDKIISETIYIDVQGTLDFLDIATNDMKDVCNIKYEINS